MKKFIVGLIILAGIAILLGKTQWPQIATPQVTEDITATPSEHISPVPTTGHDITRNGQTYRISFFTVQNPSGLFLIPNFEKQLGSQAFRKEYGCKSLTNAGFYTEDHIPLGLWVSAGEKLGEKRDSSLFNGFFSVEDSRAFITEDIPPPDRRLQIQSGPILLADSRARVLKLKTDENARRVFAALAQDGRVYFGTVYNPEELYDGPLLADLPVIVSDFSAGLPIPLTDAINLDGGSASAYADESVFLGEIATVGSFFCVR